MKGLLLIVSAVALGTVGGALLREEPPTNPKPEWLLEETAAAADPAAPRPKRLIPAMYRRPDVERLSDGSLQLTYYHDDGSRGMRIIYGPTYKGVVGTPKPKPMEEASIR